MASPRVPSSSQTYLPIQQGYVLNVRVFDNVHYPWILSDAAHANPMSVIAPQVLHEDVGGVWLGREAIISNVDPRICDLQPINIKRVEAVAIFRQGLLCRLVNRTRGRGAVEKRERERGPPIYS